MSDDDLIRRKDVLALPRLRLKLGAWGAVEMHCAKPLKGESEWVRVQDVDGLRYATPAVQPAPEVPSLQVMLFEAAILDAQLRAFERGRLDTPDEIKAAALAAMEGRDD